MRGDNQTRGTMSSPVRHCKKCGNPIFWVPYFTSPKGSGFWMHNAGSGWREQRQCPMNAEPIPMVDGIEYM